MSEALRDCCEQVREAAGEVLAKLQSHSSIIAVVTAEISNKKKEWAWNELKSKKMVVELCGILRDIPDYGGREVRVSVINMLSEFNG